MTKFDIAIITPEGPIYTGQCEQATVPGADGVFGVLAHHMDLISALLPGKVIIESTGNPNVEYFISDGIAEVSANSLSLLVESAASTTKINADVLRADLEKLENEIKVSKSEVHIKLLQSKIDYIKVMLVE